MYYVRWVKTIVSCDDSQLSFLFTVLCIGLGLVLLALPIVTIVHWTCRILIWFFLGPWMKLADIAYDSSHSTNKMTNKMTKHVKKAMDEIQLREKKGWIDARILREEILKMKATRILRFGRFAVRVPSVNVTRHHDYPLPESTARPADSDCSKEPNGGVNRYIPGQNHFGVMIPELTKPKEARKKEQQIRKHKLANLKKQFTESERRKRYILFNLTPYDGDALDLALQDLSSLDDDTRTTQQNVKKKTVHFMVEPTESLKFNPQMQEVTEEGFELFAIEECGHLCGDNTASGDREERDQVCSIRTNEEPNDKREEYNADAVDVSHCRESIEMQIETVMSDLTET